MLHPLKITSTLADETRFQIYEFMLQHQKEYNVQEIAEHFNIHPNVARLHLTKLADINVITADYIKTGKGGRPGRVYKVTEEGVSLTFPKREDPLLFQWILQLVKDLGEPAIEKGKEITYQDGFNTMKELLSSTSSTHRPLSFNQKIELLTQSAALIGYVPKIIEQGDMQKIYFSIYNCPFHNHLQLYDNVICAFHESYLRGQMDSLFSNTDFIQLESIVHNCANCKYEISINSNK
ncbi:helix-turn-helix transcriptional regulator [Lysinibacillus sp. 54212]|uniref:helix-turn-helix transcriptional regulator n=1 Tax=Lysinibacillus sp. 54212 TaxID=3119829 RepID=UPI002FCB04A8